MSACLAAWKGFEVMRHSLNRYGGSRVEALEALFEVTEQWTREPTVSNTAAVKEAVAHVRALTEGDMT